MKKILAGLGAALIVTGLAACAPVEGTVVGKTYKPDESYWMWVSVPVYNSSTNSTTIHQEYRYIPDPECFRLVIRTDDGDVKGTCVSGSEWESIEIGDYRDVK